MFNILLTEISLPLALEDFLLVIFFAIGLFFVSRIVSTECGVCGKLAFLGGLMITLGGFFKVCWKLTIATSQTDIAWMNNGLFVWLSCGFIFLAWALWRSRKDNNPTMYWLIPAILIILSLSAAGYFAFVKETRGWFFILLGITTLFNIFVSAQLISRAAKNKLWLAVGLFVFNLACAITLGGIGDQTVTMQWIKQIIGTFSQGSFAVGSYILYRSAQNSRSL